MPKDCLLIVNPVAGGGSTLRKLPEVLRFIEAKSWNCRVFTSGHPGHAEELTRKYAEKNLLIIAIGGDGTVNEVMRGALGSPSVMAIIPSGSGNDVASSLGITKHNALDILASGTIKKVDVAFVNNEPFLGVASCGLDTEVNRTANRIPRLIKGAFLYTLALVIAIVKYKPMEITISTPEKTYSEKIMLLAVGHGDRYGGGMKITPLAKRDDGLLDLCLVKSLSKWMLFVIFPKVFSGKHIKHPKVTYSQAESIKIQGHGEVFADGDRKTQLPAEYSLKSGLLQLLLPEQKAQIFSK
jgi:YegS/Rv2252/BmrU family lipid kinase